VDIVNNTILAGSGGTLTAGIYVQGDSMPRVVNNVLGRTGSDRGTAIAVLGAHECMFSGKTGGGAVVLLSNSFSGWKSVVKVDYAPAAALPPTDIVAIGALNAADGDPFGGTVSGNISEPVTKTFRSLMAPDYRPVKESATLDAGVDITADGGIAGALQTALPRGVDIVNDMSGNPRPAVVPLAAPGPARGWDIGAFEYSD